MQFNIHLVIFASVPLALEIDPYSKLCGKSHLTLFPLNFEPLESQLPLATTMQNKEMGYQMGYPNDMSGVTYLIFG